MDETLPDLITATEARRLLGVSKPTLARLIREGALPTVTSPLDKRLKLVRASDVAALLQFQRRVRLAGADERAQAADADDADA